MAASDNSIWATACSLLLLVMLVMLAADGEIVERLPSIWESAESGSYHALYQLEMADSDEVLTLEEWASYNERLFRLDVIGANGRTTYLTNGATGELLRYKPFVCDACADEDLGVLAQIFLGYKWDKSGVKSEEREASEKPQDGGGARRKQVSAYGLGPLWLRASQDAERIEYLESADVRRAIGDYEEYVATMKRGLGEEQTGYEIRFYLVKGERFVKFIDWVTTAKPKGQEGGRIAARAWVIQVDYRASASESTFELPVGYGCPRQPELDVALDIAVGQVLLHADAPNQASFEVITSAPSDESSAESAGARWLSQRYSLRLLRLSKPRIDSWFGWLKTESYFASLMQFRDTHTSGSSSKSRARAKLRRVKRVWWAPDSERGQATVYTIDQASGECRTSHEDVRNQILLNFGASPAAGTVGADNNDGNQSEEVLAREPMVISADQISFLFADELDYHLIQLGETFGDEKTSMLFRNRIYEKRVRNFELLNGDGAVSWRGPVSVVKQISTATQILDSAAARPANGGGGGGGGGTSSSALSLSRDYRTTLTLLFYSDDESRLTYKAVIELLDSHEVSLEYAHAQLDVSACFQGDDKQALVIKYPLESAELSRRLQESQAAVRSQVFTNLFSHLSSAFSTLQIYAIEPTFDAFSMRLQLSILDMPLTHTFQLERNLKLVLTSDDDNDKARARRQSLVRTTASSSDACADHCAHYNCQRFSFDVASRSCDIELVREFVKTVESSTSELYTYLERRETKSLPLEDAPADGDTQPSSRARLSADSIIEYLDELVDAAAGSQEPATGDSSAPPADAPENPLVLKLDLTPPNLIDLGESRGDTSERKLVTLWPSALEHDLESMQEYSRELDESGRARGGPNSRRQAVVRVSGGRAPRLQYNILLADRIFETLTGTKLEGVTYEECERQCELADCRSFSYCVRDETCRTSWQHNEKFIRSTSKPAAAAWQCNVYSLDYLSKFESYGRVLAPLRASGHEDALSAADCASSCMDARSYQCQGFYFCRLPPSQLAPTQSIYKCYLVDWHANSMLEHERSALLNPAHLVGAGAAKGTAAPGEKAQKAAGDTRECEFYSRSYLAQFDKYFGRRLDLEQASELGVTVRIGQDLESCAKQCIKLSCLAFDACPEPTGGDAQPAAATGVSTRLQAAAARRSASCQLAIKSIRAGQLKREPRCTTFVLSDKSHFNRQKMKLIPGNASDAKPDAKPEAKPDAELQRPDKEANIGRSSTGVSEDPHADPTRDVNGRGVELLESYGKIDEDLHGDGDPIESRDKAAPAHTRWLGKTFSLALGVLLGFGLMLGWNEAYARGWLDRASRARLGL